MTDATLSNTALANALMSYLEPLGTQYGELQSVIRSDPKSKKTFDSFGEQLKEFADLVREAIGRIPVEEKAND